MDERSALDVTAVRVIETDEAARVNWSDVDRAWASRAAAEVVGERATPAAFLGRRAALALERLGEHDPRFVRAVRALRWRSWIGVTVIAGAFVAGIAIDRIGGAQTINLLAPPLFLLLAWNLAVYAALAAAPLFARRRDGAPGLMRGVLVAWGGGHRPSIARGRFRERASRMASIATAWSALSARLYAARAARILHFAAAALALGVIAGMYVRGLAFEYRATWESTFLDAERVRMLLAVALAPGTALTRLAVPDAARIAAIRAPASENAALWLHLIAATVVVAVVAPRLALGLGASWIERRRASRLPVPLAEPYFQRLLRDFRGGTERVRVTPYSFTLPSRSIAGLEAVVSRAFGAGATLVVEGERRIALFNATATPERDVHGAFAAAIAADAARPALALVDEAAFRARSDGQAARIDARRASWREALSAARVTPVFVDLSAPDLAEAQRALDAALAGAA
jgi:hypothetical protein